MATNYSRTDAAASSLTFAQQMVAKLQAEILAGTGGVTSTSVDGTTVEVDRAQLLKALTHWQKVVARADGPRPAALTIDLGNANEST